MFPARAGMNRQPSSLVPLAKHVPRTRGDEPHNVTYIAF